MTEFGPEVMVWSGAYVVLLLLIGTIARRAMREETLSDFYLAGRSIGFLVLLLTLFATQYSGNSVSGFPGQTHREGLAYFMTVAFMVGIVSGYTLFVPRLFARARQRRFVTPTDYLADRFASPALNYASAAIFTVTLINYLLAQLMALGHGFAGLTGGRVPYWMGVVGGGLVILVYELLGGMRAVAWTDALQGLILMAGLLMVVLLIVTEVGPPGDIIGQVAVLAPGKVANPPLRSCFVWLSNFLLLALGAPLYPQAIQRIYAARGMRQLRRALSAMAFIPLFAITAVVFIGITGIYLFPHLEGFAADQVTFKVLGFLVAQEPLAYYPVLLVMLAVVAAIMSTADSCLLSLSSIFAKDFFARAKGLDARAAERTLHLGPVSSIGIMVALTLLAIRPLTTLWGLLVLKFELLIQLSPAFVLGTLHDPEAPGAFSARDILRGLGAGLSVAVALHAAGIGSLGGFHPGTIGVAVNYLTAWLSRRRRLSRGGGG